jgi:superfamily I DNA/RNA helicase
MALAGLPFPENPPREWWDVTIAEMLVAAAEGTGFEVDAVVVDEGQDFAPSWFMALQTLMVDPDHGPMYVFSDSHQAIYRPDWEPPFPGDPLELDINCRNTRPVARVVASVFADEGKDLGVDGPDPLLIPVESDEGAVKVVRGLLHRWINEGKLEETQVAILTQRRDLADRLRGTELAGKRITPLGGAGVTCETIHRFKGLEADAVVLLLDSLETDHHKMLAYVGLSRAKSLLAVVAPTSVLNELTEADIGGK